MKLAAMGVLIISAALLIFIVMKKRLGWGWISLFGTHLVLAALALYVVNFSGLISGVHVPLNPVTIGTVTILGLPGVIMLMGLKITLF
ncbi:pro-sigmaK processing inhibitor BofA family protein [Paenibacillus wynnii]|uniref:pro-sigmaK processing inhibitor BofA family protein n=1 Tax=Paenibacillus wynnii TaxID=268407 RepID=UPI00278F2108|nr:pro-sigmaK processing inhibitor BofA family protein [Paenibacillus wynnii]MDQ0196426.1 inhibitor of the pro-sigma K processing machinery [Paenibacillus wynnii]